VVKTDKCMGVSQLLGRPRPGSPKVYAYNDSSPKPIVQGRVLSLRIFFVKNISFGFTIT